MSFGSKTKGGKVTLYASGCEISSTTHNVDFNSNCEGKGSYNLTNNEGSTAVVVSNFKLFAITC